MDPIIPPKTANDSHEAYMNNFVNLLVETTQQSSTVEQLEKDTKDLFQKIVKGCRQPMVTAAQNRHSTAQIFIYLIADDTGKKPYYDLLFPNGNIRSLMDKFSIKSVYQQIVEHLAPLEVEHKIYEVYKSSAIEINNHTDELIFENMENTVVSSDDESDEPKSVDDRLNEFVAVEKTYVEGVKKLDPVRRYIGVVTVSWAKQIIPKSTN